MLDSMTVSRTSAKTGRVKETVVDGVASSIVASKRSDKESGEEFS